MSTEVSIAKQIAGNECLDSCMFELRKALASDDRFSQHMSYPGFKAVIDFKFYPHQSYIPDVERTVEVENNFTGFDGVDYVDSPEVSKKIEIPLRAPNTVREAAGLDQPVLVTDAKGHTHEEWKKIGKRPAAMKIPHNRVTGSV
jgi:hypothetical protein